MRTFFLTILLVFVSGSCFSEPMTSEDFIYTEVYECGKKRDDWESYSSYTSGNYFIHFDENNNVVILNRGLQYMSFETNTISQLYFQNGGEHSLEFTQNDNVYIFQLIEKEYRKRIKGTFSTRTIIFDKNRLTYQYQYSRQNIKGETYNVDKDSRKTGFCHRIKTE